MTTAAEYQQQGRKLIQEERFAEAIEPLTQAVKLDPFLATTFNARGYAYYRLKKAPAGDRGFRPGDQAESGVRQRVHESQCGQAGGRRQGGRGRRSGKGAGLAEVAADE